MKDFFSYNEIQKKKYVFISVLLFIYAVLICSRIPEILITGRFWAEEANVFLHNAFVMPPWQALFNSYGGYLNIIANAATLLASRTTSIAFAPYVTITIGLIFQLLPPFILLTAKDEWLKPLSVRIAAIALLLFVPCSAEVWLQVLHCQFELILACALILSLEENTGKIKFFYLFILFLAPLSGPGSIVFTVLFLLRFITDRTTGRLLQFLALSAGVAIQFSFFYHTDGSRGSQHWLQPAFAAVFCREIIQGFGGVNRITAKIILYIKQSFENSIYGLIWPQLMTVVFFAPPFVMSCLSKKSRVCFWLILANACFTGAALYGSLGGPLSQIEPYSGERYIVVGQSLLFITILAFFVTSTPAIRRFAPYVISWLLIVGMITYWKPVYKENGPPWRGEVQKWQLNHSYPMKVWPDGWTVKLP